MGELYNRADIYDLLETEERFQGYKRCWERTLEGTDIRSLLDVSIGSGCVTLPLAELGVEVSGSDLSEAMLENCRKKARQRGWSVELRQSDFRDLSCWSGMTFDCVASTGNSLPYVENDALLAVLERMDALVREGGYLYFDMRSWDRILRERNRFYLYNPFFDGDTRINLVQVWDYLEGGDMMFHLLYTFERENRIFQKETFDEHYFPVARQLLLDKLRALGYGQIRQSCFPSLLRQDAESAEWYCVLAKKERRG